MKLVRYTSDGATRIGKVVDGGVVDLSGVTGPGASMKSVLERWDSLRASLERTEAPPIPLNSVRLEAPIDDPRKFLAIGMNYEKHAKEAEAAGLLGLKGHRALGGMRASIYNAMPVAGVQALVDFMGDFARRNG